MSNKETDISIEKGFTNFVVEIFLATFQWDPNVTISFTPLKTFLKFICGILMKRCLFIDWQTIF